MAAVPLLLTVSHDSAFSPTKISKVTRAAMPISPYWDKQKWKRWELSVITFSLAMTPRLGQKVQWFLVSFHLFYQRPKDYIWKDAKALECWFTEFSKEITSRFSEGYFCCITKNCYVTQTNSNYLITGVIDPASWLSTECQRWAQHWFWKYIWICF